MNILMFMELAKELYEKEGKEAAEGTKIQQKLAFQELVKQGILWNNVSELMPVGTPVPRWHASIYATCDL
jgi:hypothetical protein